MELLATNTVHGLVALIWLLSLRRLAGPMSASSWTRLLELGVALPLLATVLRAFDALAPPQWLSVLRTDRWHDALATSSTTLWLPALLLAGGTALLFIAQELVPRLADLRASPPEGQEDATRLQASLERVKTAFARQGSELGNARSRARLSRARVRSLDSPRRHALLSGVSTPTVLVSHGLAEALDDEALDAVIAHELAHLFVGGHARLLWLWVLRLPQAASPATLLLFRSLIEWRESACDALAARVTGAPLALAAALLEAHRRVPRPGDNDSSLARAQRRVLRRAEVASVRARVARLRLEPASASGRAGASDVSAPYELSLATQLLALLLLGGLLWLIG